MSVGASRDSPAGWSRPAPTDNNRYYSGII
jgi:hypothetical protein